MGLSRKQKLAILAKRDGGMKCAHCGATAKLQINHICPPSAGGTNQIDNLQILCQSCGSRKGKRPDPYREGLQYTFEELQQIKYQSYLFHALANFYQPHTAIYHDKYGFGIIETIDPYSGHSLIDFFGDVPLAVNMRADFEMVKLAEPEPDLDDWTAIVFLDVKATQE